MKGYFPASLLVLALCAGASKNVGVNFGPRNCVSLTRSSAGSCVLTTDCEGADISKTEFAFDCVGQGNGGDVVRHSFGVGGFEASEEFDTEVKCGRCATPTSVEAQAAKPKHVEAILKPAPEPKVEAVQKEESHKALEFHAEEKPAEEKAAEKKEEKAEEKEEKAEKKEEKAEKKEEKAEKKEEKAEKKEEKGEEKAEEKAEKAEEKPAEKVAEKPAEEKKAKGSNGWWPFSGNGKKENQDAVKYGPNGCVSVYKSKEGHCIMSTKCEKNDISNYEFGLVCVDKTGSPVKHLFGKDSFDAEETFDTLIKCDQCLGLEDVPDTVALAGEVATMGKDIGQLKAVMRNISINVQMLNEEVFPKKAAAPAPGPAAEPAAPAVEPKPEEALVHQSVTHHKHHGNLRHSHKRHHRRHRHYDDDDDEDDREDDADDYADEDREYSRERLARVPRRQEPKPVQAVQYVPLNEVSKTTAQVQTSSYDDDDDDDGNEED